MKHQIFSLPERMLALSAGILNSIVGLAFFFLPELQLPLWPVDISPILTRFIGAIIIGNGVGAIWLSTEREWARVRPLALVAAVYGTLVALALLYHLLWLNASPFFWLYFAFDVPFLLVFYGLFVYHDIAPRFRKPGIKGLHPSG
jgi:O-antigen/teichoic acid export membrane protein